MGLNVKHFTDAFKKTGIKPVKGIFCEISGNKRKTCSGCAFTALYLSAHDLTEKELVKLYKMEMFEPQMMEAAVESWAEQRYGYDFVHDFITSFDGYGKFMSENDSPGEKLGYKVRQAVLKRK